MNIFQAVIRPFQTQTSQTGVTNQQTAGASDREEDGFLMVAETESERTTVYASDFTGDTPPDYNQVGHTKYPLPTYMDYMERSASQTFQQESTMSYNTVTSRAVLATKEKHRFSNTQQFIQDGKISISQHRLRC